MRFLFVYQDYARQARALLDEVATRDVKLITVQKDASSPTDEEFKLLEAHRGVSAAVCGVNRKYQKAVLAMVEISCSLKVFRFEDKVLREWLVPRTRAEENHSRPSVAFVEASKRSLRLVLHPNALDGADSIATHRWEFVSLSAKLLASYANGEALGPLRDWKRAHGIDFAANGRVAYKYQVNQSGNVVCRGKTEWHLKEGDNTSREAAARVYFDCVKFCSETYVLVFYVGPHPEDGERSLLFLVP